jgi:hypothetical protein
MDAIREYAERTTLTKEIGDAFAGAALYFRGGRRGRGSVRGHGHMVGTLLPPLQSHTFE